jgi:hypothetical protein
MPVSATVLFDKPQREIASLIVNRMSQSSATSIVTGFATPGGLAAIAAPIKARPQSLVSLVVGSATYPGFETLDDLLAAGVAPDRLRVHLGHTAESGSRKHPYFRYHPMLHSKVYYMELPGSNACAFIGSHNVTSFALTGLNGEAAVMVEGPRNSPEFQNIRDHVETARTQAIIYSPGMKEAFAWWLRQFIDGMKAEIKIPVNWMTVRTILLFAEAAKGDRPAAGDHLYFEIPDGIEQIDSLKTETHLFLFDTLPPDPWQAISSASNAVASYTCKTLGAENRQGNRELLAKWRIDATSNPVLKRVPSSVFRPNTPVGKQQVRAEVDSEGVIAFDYQFERDKAEWSPKFFGDHEKDAIINPPRAIDDQVLQEALVRRRVTRGWKLVAGLVPRLGPQRERDEAALKLAAPESGSFILVSLRRRERDESQEEENES